ncbi:MAG: hypothetical protein AAFW73_23645 [Bacteroidota bacterium]
MSTKEHKTTSIEDDWKLILSDRIYFHDLIERAKQEFKDLLQRLPNNDSAEFRDALFDLIRKQIRRTSDDRRGKLSEHEYLQHLQHLEEALLCINEGKFKFTHLFGLGTEKGSEEDLHDWEKYNFAPLLYLHLGLFGGTFAIADQVNDRIRIQHSALLQDRDEWSDQDKAFIDIAYRYADQKQHEDEDKDLLDAMYTSVRHSHKFSKATTYSPEFYLYMPHLLPHEHRKNLLPYERRLTRDKFKMIYCGVGEVLFHLFAWRMLFHKIQARGIEHQVSTDTFLGFHAQNYEVWEEIWNYAQKTAVELPELDWLRDFNNRLKFSGSDKQDLIKKLEQVWSQKIKAQVDLGATSDKLQEEEVFTMREEYRLLGMVRKATIGGREIVYYTRSFLEFIRYTLHVVRAVLAWEAKGLEGGDERTKILQSLEILESRLDNYYQENPGVPTEEHTYLPTYENLRPHLHRIDNQHEEETGKIINDILLKVAKAYLMKGRSEAPVLDLLKNLHRRCRFPILPYYYGTALSADHQAMEHVVFCVWDSKENPIELPPLKWGGDKRKDSGVAFVLLTLFPIWKIRPQFNFLKNGNGIHYACELSVEAYQRISRLYDFFSLLIRPILDQVFYGDIIRQAHQREAVKNQMNAISHELGKTTRQLLKNSNIPLEKLFGENADKVLETIHQYLDAEEKPSLEEIKAWVVAPDPDRLKDWQTQISLFIFPTTRLLAGHGGGFFDLEGLIHYCWQITSRIHATGEMKNIPALRRYDEVRKNRAHFEHVLSEIPDKIPLHVYPESYFKRKIKRASSEMELTGQADFTRLLVTGFSNTLKHMKTAGEFALFVNHEPDGKMIDFCILNQTGADPATDKTKSDGTYGIMIHFTEQVKGKINSFGCGSKLIERLPETHRAWVKENCQTGTAWVTRFSVPTEILF